MGIDCRFASGYAGLGTYTRSLVSSLLKRDDLWRYTLFVGSTEESWLAGLPDENISIVEAPYRHYSFAEQLHFPGAIRRSRIDLLFSPHFNVPFFCPVPFVCTIHDTILHCYPNDAPFWRRLAYSMLVRRSVRRAREIVTVSRTTKDDIAEIWGDRAADKVSVVYPGIGAEFSPRSNVEQETVRKKFCLPGAFFLYVGGAKQHKNVPVLIEAFGQFSNNFSPPQRQRRNIEESTVKSACGASAMALVLVTSGKEATQLRLPENVRILQEVAQADLPALYSAAAGFVTATLYEGFGLPLLEAMACACPVLAPKIGSIPEVCGDAAMLVEPTADALAHGMEMLLAGDRSARRERGRAQAAKYSWDSAAEQVAEIFSSAMRGGGTLM